MLAAEEPDEITIEVVEKLVHIDNIAGGDPLSACWSFRRDRLFLFINGEGISGETPKGKLSLLRIAIVEHGGDEVPGMAVVALDQHGPDIGLAGEHANIIGIKLAVADNATIHLLQDDVFNLNFGIHGVFL